MSQEIMEAKVRTTVRRNPPIRKRFLLVLLSDPWTGLKLVGPTVGLDMIHSIVNF